MNDVPITELLSAYLDGELTADEQAGVELMLSTDPSARQLLDEMRAVGATLQSLPQQKIGEDLSQRVLDVAARRMIVGDRDDSSAANASSGETASDEVRPLWKELTWRGLFSRRALAWSGVAVALAILISWYEPQRNPPVRIEVKADRKEKERKLSELASAVHGASKVGEAAGDTAARGLTAKPMGPINRAFVERKSPEMSSADSPVNSPEQPARVADKHAVLSDAGKAVVSDQTAMTRRATQGWKGEQRPSMAEQKNIEQQNKEREILGQIEANQSLASDDRVGGRGGRNADKMAKNEGVAPVEKPVAAPLPSSMAAAAPASAAKPIASHELSDAKGDVSNQVALADQSSDAKKAISPMSKSAVSKDVIGAKKSGQIAAADTSDKLTNGNLFICLDVTRQAANDRVFEKMLAQTGLSTQTREGDRSLARKDTAPNGSVNLVLRDGMNSAGIGGGALSQAQSPVSAPSGNMSNGTFDGVNYRLGNTTNGSSGTNATGNGARQNVQNGANSAVPDKGGQLQATPPGSGLGGIVSKGSSGNWNYGIGNTASSNSTTFAIQNGTMQNGTMQNGTAQNGIAQNGVQTYSGGQNLAAANAVAQNAAPAAIQSQPAQNMQMPAIANSIDSLNSFANSAAISNVESVLGVSPQIVEADATADQVAAVRKALSSNHNDFPSVSFPNDTDRAEQNNGDVKSKRARVLLKNSESSRLASPESNAAKSPAAGQTASNLTHIVFEVRIVDPINSKSPASSVLVGAQPAISGTTALQFSGTSELNWSGSANYQITPALTAPAPAAPALPLPTTPSPAPKQ